MPSRAHAFDRLNPLLRLLDPLSRERGLRLKGFQSGFQAVDLSLLLAKLLAFRGEPGPAFRFIVQLVG